VASASETRETRMRGSVGESGEQVKDYSPRVLDGQGAAFTSGLSHCALRTREYPPRSYSGGQAVFGGRHSGIAPKEPELSGVVLP
jgi:hypothetical protein